MRKSNTVEGMRDKIECLGILKDLEQIDEKVRYLKQEIRRVFKVSEDKPKRWEAYWNGRIHVKNTSRR